MKRSLIAPGRSPKRVLYKVVGGSFPDKQHALNRVSFLKQQQIDAFIEETDISGETYYRVHAGAFLYRKYAEIRVKELEKMGICEPFVIATATLAERAQTPSGCALKRLLKKLLKRFK